MLKYYTAAAGLKLLSLNDTTVKAYRKIGNVLGGKRRSGEIRSNYFERSDKNLRFLEENDAIRDGISALELGTGWVHWEALFTSAFYDVRFTLFDVWDNRQFQGFLHYANGFRAKLRNEISRSEVQLRRAEEVLDRIIECANFDEVYEILGWQYITDWNGSLHGVHSDSLDLIISSDVLEHVHVDGIADLACQHMRVLKEGGRAAHQVVFTDHLTIYDQSMHTKNYLHMSDRTWKLIGENRVQYVNRLQPSEVEKIFTESGLKVIAEKTSGRCEIDPARISPRFSGYSKSDLETTVKSILLEKSIN